MKTNLAVFFMAIIAMIICVLPVTAYVSVKPLPGGCDPQLDLASVELYQFQPIGQVISTRISNSGVGVTFVYADTELPAYFGYFPSGPWSNPFQVEVSTIPPPSSPYYADFYAFDMDGGTWAYVTVVPVIDKWTFI